MKKKKIKVMQCFMCKKFISAIACNFGCPHCGYAEG